MPKAKVLRKTASVGLREDGRLRLALVADTHSAPHPRTREILTKLAPDAIVHAGDIGNLEVLSDLEVVAPVLAVRGNIDTDAAGVPDELLIDVRDGEDSLFSIFLLHIGVYGPKLRADAARKARASGASIVVCGHSHVPFIGKDQGLAVFNPGSIGPRRFQLPIVMGVLDVERPARVGMHHVSCETGERWAP